jgi:hypothetical protein
MVDGCPTFIDIFSHSKVKTFTCTVRNAVFHWLGKIRTSGILNWILQKIRTELFKTHTRTVPGKPGWIGSLFKVNLLQREQHFLIKVCEQSIMHSARPKSLFSTSSSSDVWNQNMDIQVTFQSSKYRLTPSMLQTLWGMLKARPATALSQLWSLLY